MINTKLTELPGHGHYAACADRMHSIDRFCRKQCGYTLAASILMLILTWCTVRLSVISIIPNLIGDRASLAANFVQTLLILSVAGFSVLSVYRYKIFSVVLFIIYAAMFAVSCFSYDPSSYFSIIIGFIGAIFSYKSIYAFLDYNQLQHTEGFPEFNERLAYQNENKEYVSRFEDRIHSGGHGEMSETEHTEASAISEKTENTQSVGMDEI